MFTYDQLTEKAKWLKKAEKKSNSNYYQAKLSEFNATCRAYLTFANKKQNHITVEITRRINEIKAIVTQEN